MKHTAISLIMIVLLILPLTALTVSANSPPQPDFIVHFSGIEGTCYMTLLNKDKVDEGGIYHISEDGKRDTDLFDNSLFGRRRTDEIADPIFQAFYQYEDPDGYNFVQQMADVSDGESFYEYDTYPKDFKILLYFPDSGSFASSEKLSAYTYFNCFNVTVEDESIISVTKTSKIAEYGMNFGNMMYILFLLIQTILIEILVAIPFGFRHKKHVLTVFVTNLLTHPLMIGLMMVLNPPISDTIFSLSIILFEIGVTIAEMLVYLWLFPKFDKERIVKKWKIAAFAVVANLVTYVLSALIPDTIVGFIISHIF